MNVLYCVCWEGMKDEYKMDDIFTFDRENHHCIKIVTMVHLINVWLIMTLSNFIIISIFLSTSTSFENSKH